MYNYYSCIFPSEKEVTEPTVTVFPPSESEICDQIKEKRKPLKVTLLCAATNFYPDHVSVIWMINNDDQTKQGAVGKVGTDNNALRDKDGMYSITSRLRVPLNIWGNKKKRFTCIVRFFNGTAYIDAKNHTDGKIGMALCKNLNFPNYISIQYL